MHKYCFTFSICFNIHFRETALTESETKLSQKMLYNTKMWLKQFKYQMWTSTELLPYAINKLFILSVSLKLIFFIILFCVLFIFLAIYIFWFSVLESRRKNRNVSRTTSFLIGCWVVLKNEKGYWWLGGSKFDSYFKLFRFFLNLASYFTWNMQRFKDIAIFCNKIRFSNVKSSKTRERKG